jgi:hypothetical protein
MGCVYYQVRLRKGSAELQQVSHCLVSVLRRQPWAASVFAPRGQHLCSVHCATALGGARFERGSFCLCKKLCSNVQGVLHRVASPPQLHEKLLRSRPASAAHARRGAFGGVGNDKGAADVLRGKQPSAW